MARRIVSLCTAFAFAGCGSSQPEAEEPAPTPVAEPVETPAEPDPTCPNPPGDDPTAAPASVAAPPEGVRVDESGLASCVLRAGTGTQQPGERAQVTVHYSGWTTDGELFDSSYQRGEPASFGLHQVIEGWTEGVQLMVEGEKRRLWIPEALAYRGQLGRPAGMLVFDVELISIP